MCNLKKSPIYTILSSLAVKDFNNKLASWNLYLLMAKQGRNQQLYDEMNIVLIMDTGDVHWKL